MQKLILSLFATLMFLNLHGQFKYPVKWTSEWKQVSATEYDVIVKGTIDPGWNIYSQYLESDDGPIATQLTLEAGDHFTSVGKTGEDGTIKKGYDKIFEMNVTKIFDQAIFTQRVNVSDVGPAIKGYLTYMICDAEQCLPPTDFEFEVQLENRLVAEVAEAQPEEETTGSEETIVIPSTDASIPALVDIESSETEETNGNPVQWTTAIEKLEDGFYQIQLIANFNKPWTLYSQVIEGDGPIPTTFTFEEGGHYELVGPTTETATKIKEGFDKTFEIDVKKFVEGPAIFTQKVKVADPSKAIIGDLVFMTCDDEMCLPPAYQFFQFDVDQLSGKISSEPFEEIEEAIVDVPQAIQTLYGTLTPPDMDSPLATCQTAAPAVQKSSLWKIFSLGFLGGLIALLTPCIFPMIPLTVSFFTKRSQTRSKGINNALVYGGFIVFVYLLLSIPFHLLTSVSPDILNQISTNIWLNLAFFVIFLVFAFSFFGYFELTLPASWTNKTAQAEGIGGVVGIFFMALTLALVSFSCTGPILGTLLVGALSSDGGAWQLTAGMGGFGLGLALPFGFFAAFPGFMNALPKSGGWLNTVKVTLGFLELALALKFLSNADMVKHWGILKVELFLGLWILIFAGLALYLFGLIKFPHDSPLKKLSIPRLALGGLSAAFVIYLASGFMINPKMDSYRPLKLLSGTAPPVCYSYFKPCDCPQQLSCFKDLKEGLAYAKEVNKPVLLDFTGYACVNCRRMEEHVWPEPEIYPYLKDDYVLISLYVDDKKALPAEEQLRVETFQGTKTLKTYGNKWSYFQENYFNAVAQPYYVLVTPDLDLLNSPAAYTPDKQTYAEFLECGKMTFGNLGLNNTGD